MGLLDKVKAQAQSTAATAGALAKDAAQKGQAKIDAIQAKRTTDAMLRNLGALVYGQKVGRAPSTAQADVERLVDSLRAYEAEHGLIDLMPESQDAS